MRYDSTVARRGKFITIEGLDGCGKSTQLEKLATVLRDEGLDVVVTREPGGTPSGEKIRAVLLDSRTSGLSAWAELALMFAARAQHIDEVILPALNAGKFVLCDRFTDSSEAYQGGGRKLGSEPVLELHKAVVSRAAAGLDDPHGIGRRRQRGTGPAAQSCTATRRAPTPQKRNPTRIASNKKAVPFFERVIERLRVDRQARAGRVFTVNARRAPDVVHEEIVAAVRKRLAVGRRLSA